MSKYVNNSAAIKCSFGTIPSKVSANRPVSLDKNPLLTKADTDIGSFGMCTSPQNPSVVAAQMAPQPCSPKLIGCWSSSSTNMLAQGQNALTDRSTLTCMYGGKISFLFVAASASTGATLVSPPPGNSTETNKTANEKTEFSPERTDKTTENAEGGNPEQRNKHTTEEVQYCPFCKGKLDEQHNNKYYNPDAPDKVESKPYQLDCKKLTGEGIGRYKTANHHIIPVNEVYNSFRELVKLTVTCGYDINSPRNGIGLPTPIGANPYRITDQANKVIEINFGQLEGELEPQKREIAFKYMKELGKQWHSGGHTWTTDDKDAFNCYTMEVIPLLTEFETWLYSENLYGESICDSEEDKTLEIIEKMNAISDKIRKKLDAFSQPRKSTPFFVSQFAADFAMECKE